MPKKIFVSFKLCFVAWLVVFGFVLGAIGSATAAENNRPECEGWWSYVGNKNWPNIFFVMITATKQRGVYQVEGANFAKKSKKLISRIAGTYREDKNELLGTIHFLVKSIYDTDFLVDGSMAMRQDGTPCLILDIKDLDFGQKWSVELTKVPDEDISESPSPAVPVGIRELEITSLTVEPSEVESGATVTLKYEFMARDIPDTALAVDDVVTVTGPIPAPAKGEMKRSLTHFQHQPNGMDGGGSGAYTMSPTEPGSYKCTLELKADGYPDTVKRDITFTVKPNANQPATPGVTTGAGTGAANIPPGTEMWVLERTVISSGDKEGRVPPGLSGASKTGFIYSEKSPDGNDCNNSMIWSAPPKTITDGAPVCLTIQASSSPWANVSGWWNFSDRGVTTEWKGDKLVNSYEQGVKRSGTLTFKFKPSNSSEAWIQVSAGHDPNPDQWYLVTWVYTKKQAGTTGTTTAPATESDNTGTQLNPDNTKPLTLVNAGSTGNAGEPQARLSVRMKSLVLVLTPGESSWPNDVGISGWRVNTADRVEIDIPVQDNWGSLKINRNLVVAPGPTSMPPSEMVGPEDWFSQVWSARIVARPGIYTVPVIVRQAGAGEAAVMFTIYVIPKAISGYLSPASGNDPGGRPALTGGQNTMPGGRPAVSGGTFATPDGRPFFPSDVIPTDRPIDDSTGTASTPQDTVSGEIDGSQDTGAAPTGETQDTVSGAVQGSPNTVPGALGSNVSESDHMAALDHQEAGNRFSDDGRWAEAEREFRAGVKLDPEATDMWEQLASACAEQKKWDDSIAALRQAIQLNPQEPFYRFELSSILRSSGREAEAEQEQKEGERLQKEMENE